MSGIARAVVELAERHVFEAERRVTQQLVLLVRLRARGADVAGAEATLAIFEAILATMHDDLRRVHRSAAWIARHHLEPGDIAGG